MRLNGFEKSVRITTYMVVLLLMSSPFGSAAPPTDADCTSNVPFADTENCTSYYQCFNVDSEWMLLHLPCPSGGMWDDVNKACVLGTCEVPTTTTTDPTTMSSTISDSDPTTSAEGSSSLAASSTSASSSSEDSSTPPTTLITTITSSETEMTTSTTNSTVGPPTFVCTSTGLFAHPTDPTKYYQCVLIGAQFYYYVYSCPPNSCFLQSAGTCEVGGCLPSNTTTASPGTTTTGVTTPPVDIVCNSTGQYPLPGSCTKYYSCNLLDGGFVYYVFECPPGSFFNAITSLCTTGPCPSTSATTTATTPTAATTTTPSTTTTALVPTTAGPDHPCPSEGYFSDPVDCQAYYRCVVMNGQMYRYMFRCPAGAYWNSNLQGCIVGVCPTTTGMTSPTSTTVAAKSSTSQPFSCSQVGTFPDPSNCSIYHRCLQFNNSGPYYSYTYSCPPNTIFDSTKQLCAVGSC